VCVKVTPSDASNPSGTAGVSGTFTIDNIAYNQPPSATVATPAGVQSGNVQINYFVADVESDTCSIAVLYSTNDGTSWQAATMGPAGDGITGLTSSPSGTAHVYLWDSRADNIAPSGQLDTVRIRIMPTDFNAGTAGETNSFSVDNSITNDPPTVAITSGPAEGSTVATTQVTFTWIGSDTDGTVTGYYYSFDHDPPDVWTTDTSVTSGVLSEDSHVFRVVAVDDQFDLSTVASRTFTVSTGGPGGDTIYVDGTSGNDTNDGLTWATAIEHIQTGLDKASSGSTVFVANGTYTGTSNKDLNFVGKAIHLKSVNGSGACIIDCEGEGRGFIFDNSEGNSSIVEGFCVRNGKTFAKYSAGAGVICWGSSPTITGCMFENCSAWGTDSCGGGIACYWGSNSVISNCIVSGNMAYRSGGGIYCWESSSPRIVNCLIKDNTAQDSGGGIFCDYSSSPQVINCMVTNNMALGFKAGGIYCSNSSSPTITNCTIVGNQAETSGGGIFCVASAFPALYNSIIWGNSANDGGNEIFAANGSGTVTIAHCDTDDGANDIDDAGNHISWGAGNIHLEPLFVNASAQDYHLQDGSPCIDAGDNSLVPGGVTTDLDDNPRIFDGDGDTVVTVDMGAYEFGSSRNWVILNPANRPSTREGAGMAFDTASGEIVLFGGWNSGHFGDTWTWNGTNWTPELPADSPSPRSYPEIVYDALRGVALLFGGSSTGGVRFDETWEWDGTTWTQKFPSNRPTARYGHKMAYDSNRGVAVLFGGYDKNYDVCNDTWEWDGTNWVQKSPSQKPSPRQFHAMAYDAARGAVVLFGGSVGGYSDETWEWSGTNWTEKFPANRPSPRGYHTMTYDSVHEVIVLFGGYYYDGSEEICFNDTWEWNGENWVQKSTAESPTARCFHAMTYDSAREAVMLFGGRAVSSQRFSDTWKY
jgi:parallel beta-helix repeat protein